MPLFLLSQALDGPHCLRYVRAIFSISMSALKSVVHQKARFSPYLNGPARFPVPDECVAWKKQLPAYDPPFHEDKTVAAQPVWADNPEDLKAGKLHFNAVDGKINRRSHQKEGYELIDGYPRNPNGRTGLRGRGLLGRFGPNHAADPIVTRWQRDANGIVRDTHGHKVLEFVGIKRRDNGEWAIPGGMVDAGDKVSVTLKREFGEEALNTMELSDAEKANAKAMVEELFKDGWLVYKGYVDDPRNTDNAWMETVAINFHDETGELTKNFKLAAGDDAGAVKWITISPDLRLYASHAEFLQQVVEHHLHAKVKCSVM
eukprot:m.82684 g.82684  ORF g.82684 m.82684 type:complete len:316 (-) comp8130_c0_seq2:126-1073(-)